MQLFSAQELYVCLLGERVKARWRKSFGADRLQHSAPLLERVEASVVDLNGLQSLQASFTRWSGVVWTCGRLLIGLELCADTDAANILGTDRFTRCKLRLINQKTNK
jgi:hypothetical protein